MKEGALWALPYCRETPTPGSIVDALSEVGVREEGTTRS